MNTREDSSFASSMDGGNAAYKARYGDSTANAGAVPQRRSERLLGGADRDAGDMRGLSGSLTADYRSLRPLTHRLAATAEIDGQSMADEGAIDVSAAFDRSLGTMQRDMSRMGINPSSGRFAGLQQKWGRAKAAATAGAMTRARRGASRENFSRLLSASQAGLNTASRAGGLSANAGQMSRGLANDWGDIAYGESFQGSLDSILAGLGA